MARHARLLGIVGLAIAYLATRWLFADRFPYFFDEGTYAGFTRQGADSLDQLFVSLTIGREPLLIWLAIPPVELGLGPLSAVRLVSIVAGLLTVAVIGALGRWFGGPAVGWIAASLAVVTPFLLVHDAIGIYEPLVTLIMAAALLAQVHLARRPSLGKGLVLGGILAAGVLTKRNTLPAVALLPASLLLLDWAEPGRRERLTRFATAVAVAAVPVVAAMLLLRSSSYWARYEEFSRVGAGGIGFAGVRPVGDVLRDPFAFTGQAWDAYGPAFVTYVTAPLLVACAGGAVLAWRTRPRSTALLVLWVVVPLAVALTFGTLSFPRHVMYLLPPMLVLMAFALERLARAALAAWPRPAAVAACAAGALVALGPALLVDARVLAEPDSARYPGPDDLQFVRGTQAGSPWPGVVDAIERRARGRQVDVVLFRSYPDVIRFLLRPEGRYRLVETRAPEARSAQFVVRDESDFVFPDDPGPALVRQRFREVAQFPRPRGGAVVRLYENRAMAAPAR